MAVRPRGGAAGRPSAAPSPAELRNVMGKREALFGIDQGAMREFIGGERPMLSPTNTGMQSPISGVPISASRGEFSEVISIFNDQNTMEYYSPQSRQKATARNQAGTPVFYEDNDGSIYAIPGQEDRVPNRPYYDIDEDSGEWVIPGLAGPQYGEDTRPAPLSLVPTSTTNPARPRTVAAGYDKNRQVITVVFRDGTWYNYYECDAATWQAFKARVSKGQYIYKYLDFHSRGPANVADFSDASRALMYRIVRTSQIKMQGEQFYRNQKTKKPKKKK